MNHICRALIFATACGICPALAQVSAPDLLLRVDQLENQVRQLTGHLEQLQYRNQQLEQQVRRLQEDGGGKQAQPARPGTVPPAAAPTGRRDVFDPALNPDAPGAPRPLGVPGRRSESGDAAGTPVISAEEPIGAPGGRPLGAPLDLSALASTATRDPSRAGEDLPPRNPNAANITATLAPTPTARDEYDLGYGYVLHKDYALAEEALRAFLKKYPDDRLAADAQFWLGEAMFQRQSYRDAAATFLDMSKKYENHAKAPEALLRLGQSLAALNERELACATFGEIARKYPRAPANVKQTIERELKRVRC